MLTHIKTSFIVNSLFYTFCMTFFKKNIYMQIFQPLALVAWGCRLQMAAVDDRAAMNFIQTRAHRGPEGTYTKEGQYDLRLLASGKSSGNGAKYGYSRVSCDTLDLSRL